MFKDSSQPIIPVSNLPVDGQGPVGPSYVSGETRVTRRKKPGSLNDYVEGHPGNTGLNGAMSENITR